MRRILPSLFALLLSAALLQLGNGLQFTLIPLRADLGGLSLVTVGLITTGYFVGFLLGSVMGARLIGDVGHVRVLTGALAGIAALVLLYPLALSGAVWVIARFGSGFALAIAYMSVESWLNERTPAEIRGRVLSLYALSGFLMLALGQLLLGQFPIDGFEPFSVAAIAVAIATLPVAFSRAPGPAIPPRRRVRLAELFEVSRVAVIGIVAAGLSNAAFWAYAPVFVRRAGLDFEQTAVFMASVLLGGAVMTWPIGALSDRFDRRIVIGFINLGASLAASAILLTAGRSMDAVLLAGFVYGAFAFSLYAICAAHANDNADAANFVALSSGLLFLFGVSAILGPLGALGLGLWAGPRSVFLFTAAVHLLAGLTVFILMRRRRATPAEAKSPFRPVPRTTPAAFELQTPEAAEFTDAAATKEETPTTG